MRLWLQILGLTPKEFLWKWVFQWSLHTWVQFNTYLFDSGAKYLYTKFRQEAVIIKANNLQKE
jgi:hypothetical protein